MDRGIYRVNYMFELILFEIDRPFFELFTFRCISIKLKAFFMGNRFSKSIHSAWLSSCILRDTISRFESGIRNRYSVVVNVLEWDIGRVPHIYSIYYLSTVYGTSWLRGFHKSWVTVSRPLYARCELLFFSTFFFFTEFEVIFYLEFCGYLSNDYIDAIR